MSTLAERYDPRSNAFGLLRLLLAMGVLVAHSQTVGFAQPPLGLTVTRGQIDLGSVAVKGFFLISGFLVTGSALRISWPRFGWHRLLRIMPAYWVCLVVTAFVFAPFVAYLERGTIHGIWHHPESPFRYVWFNAFLSMDQYRIGGLLTTTPFGRYAGGPSAFDGSLWSLRYEAACYVLIALLSVLAVLRRARWAVLFLTLCTVGLAVRDVVVTGQWAFHPVGHPELRPFPMVGAFTFDQVQYLLVMFLLGACAYLYRERIPMNGLLAAAAAAVFVVTLTTGGFLSLGLLAYAYLLLYAALALPRKLHRIGVDRDYSYGIYIYAFPMQQILGLLGATRFGPVAYLALTVLMTAILAALSWHLVERPAMSLKGARVPFVGRRATAPTVVPVVVPAQATGEPPAGDVSDDDRAIAATAH
jgi:peptidoglycan/LPS O-acetylase OafA/YrhL